MGEDHSLFIYDVIQDKQDWSIVGDLFTLASQGTDEFDIQEDDNSVVFSAVGNGGEVIVVGAVRSRLTWRQRLWCAALGLRFSAAATCCFATLGGCVGSGGTAVPMCLAAAPCCCAAFDWFFDILDRCGGVDMPEGLRMLVDVVDTICFFS